MRRMRTGPGPSITHTLRDKKTRYTPANDQPVVFQVELDPPFLEGVRPDDDLVRKSRCYDNVTGAIISLRPPLAIYPGFSDVTSPPCRNIPSSLTPL